VAEYRDTLAVVEIEAGDVPAGLAQFEAARRLEPGNATWAIRITEALIRGGDTEGAKTRFRQFLSEYPEDRVPKDQLPDWLRLSRSLGPPPPGPGK
jgi:hypothetical protein